LKRLNLRQRNLIINGAPESSLNQLSNKLGLSKTTVYYWYKKSGKGKKMVKVSINETDQEKTGEFIGAFAGDGNYTKDGNYRHQISISLNSKDVEYILHLSELIKFIFGKEPWRYTRTEYHVTIIRIVSKDALNFIAKYLYWSDNKTRTVQLSKHVSPSTKFGIGFLRGLMDTDGYLGKNQKIAVFSTISEGLASNITDYLTKFDIQYKLYIQKDKRPNIKPVFRIRVTRDFTKFIHLIRPYHSNLFAY